MSVLLSVFATSCKDEELGGLDYLSYGEDVTLTVPLSYPEMEVQSRADRDDAQLNLVRTLWVRTYSSITNEATSAWVKLTPNTEDNRVPHEVSISTKSGSSYIVGVANVANMGTTRTDPGVESPLSELLEKADTWDDFLDIAARTPYLHNDVDTVPIPVTMSGCFYPLVGGAEPHPGYKDWEENNYTPVYIPASGNSTVDFKDKGSIHLRRLVSHIKFNVKPGENVTITPESYSIVNVPRNTWLYERGGAHKNFGDYAKNETEAESTYYATPSMFTSQYFSDESGGSYSFNFWQGENKHEALDPDDCKSYNQREQEVKGTSGVNTGLYKSLTGESWTANNMASYVLLRCLVDYNNELYVDGDGDIVGADSSEAEGVWRSGEAEFVIHLGYLGGDAADFNCYRNVDYTYNVTILGVNQIQIEATTGNETVPGIEGLVSDSEEKMVSLDAHYAAFNIQLTKEELTNLTADGMGFGYVITAWDNGQSYSFNESSTVPKGQEKYEEWVELRPTTSQTVLAAYKPRTGNNSDGLTFTLREAANARNWASNDSRFSTNGYYTVFVNEYVYEEDDNEGVSDDESTPNWAGYVNQNPRRFYIRVTRSVSDDGESSYVRSKYAYSQQSIATYYSSTNFTPATTTLPMGTAHGVEHENETLGLNLRSSISTSSDNGVINNQSTTVDNGRYNVWLWLNYKDSNRNWTTFVDNSTITIPAVAATQGGDAIPRRTITIPKLAGYDGNFNSDGVVVKDSNGNTAVNTDPQPNAQTTNKDANYYYIEAINACMNRNRDNNGNGVVDPEEMRWYVPSSGQYVRLVLAHNTLRADALMDYEDITESINSNNRYNTRYLFYMSNNRVLWGMEGLSTSRYAQYCNSPWQIRCVRNLGSKLTTISSSDQIVNAYKIDDNNTSIIRMSYYDSNSVRSTIYTGNGNGSGTGQMPVHLINSNINRPYSAFEYSAFIMTEFTLSWTYVNNTSNNNQCSSLTGNGWRLPNQKELAIMQNLGVLSGMSGSFAPSCTMSYFSDAGAPGGSPGSDHFFMVSRSDGGTQQKSVGISSYRCVRDYPQP